MKRLYEGKNCSISSPIKVTLKQGIYRFECWGASGLNIGGGKGAYASGLICITKISTFFIYLGSQGIAGGYSAAFNGGGYSQHGGGGATDIRLVGGEWNAFDSLKSRIIVAGGGGGEDNGDKGGCGGALAGCDSVQNHGKGGTQTSGGTGYRGGAFGVGGSHPGGGDRNGGGGGGYYGGGTGSASNVDAGGGGSSFVSGYIGCNAISNKSTATNIIHTGQPNHFSGFVFTDIVLINGSSKMVSPSDSSKLEIGHRGSGFAQITLISTQNHTCKEFLFDRLLLLPIALVILESAK